MPAIFIFIIVSVLVSYADIKKRIVPDAVMIPSIIIIIFLNFLFKRPDFIFLALSGISAFFFLWAVRFFSGNKIGLGDVKYASFLAFVTGVPVWVVSVLTASLLAIGYILITSFFKKRDIHKPVAFAPFLAIGGCAGILIAHNLSSYIQ